jgi:hypothetical protein
MEDSEAIQSLKNAVTTAKEAYLANPNVPASRTQLPILEEKIAICESRLSDLETENTTDQSKDKGKGKAKISDLETENTTNQSKDKGKGKAK